LYKYDLTCLIGAGLASVGMFPTGKGKSDMATITKEWFGPPQRYLSAVALVITVLFAFAAIKPQAAEAATVRGGNQWYQVDILLSGNETLSGSQSITGSAIVCGAIIGAAAAAGGGLAHYVAGVSSWALAGVAGIAGGAACVSIVAVCTVKARLKGRWAGITVTPWSFWCWDY
jgi:hypothetical protein